MAARFLAAAACLVLLAAGAAAQVTCRVSVATDGSEANDHSHGAAISGDGTVVAFVSKATNLDVGDTLGYYDIFLRDTTFAVTERVSVGLSGAMADGQSYDPAVSTSGRFVVFTSEASNLVANDTNDAVDAFIWDRQTHFMERVSVAGASEEANGASTVGNVSTDGRFVVFMSHATNLVAGDLNGVSDIFVRDRLLARTERVSLTSAGLELECQSTTPSMSADGRYIAFWSISSLLSGIPGNCTGSGDVYVRDRQADATELASWMPGGAPSGTSTSPVISADGRHVTFFSVGVLVPGVVPPFSSENAYVADLDAHEIALVHAGTSGQWLEDAFAGSISSDGRYATCNVVFAGPVFHHDLHAGDYSNASVNTQGTSANGSTYARQYSLSGTGRFVAYESVASNLVASDTNAASDVFVRDTQAFWAEAGEGLPGSAGTPMFSASGLLLASEFIDLNLTSAKPFAFSTLVIGVTALNAPLKGGVLVPAPMLLFPFTTSFLGQAAFGAPWPPGVPSGVTTYFQWWVQDPAGPKGFAASNALAGTTP